MWYERFVIIVPSLAHSYEPWKFMNYHMGFTEARILLGSFGWFFMWFLLFLRFLPGLSMAEIKEILPPPMRAPRGGARRPRASASGSSRSFRPATRSTSADEETTHGRPGRLRLPGHRHGRDRAAARRTGYPLTVYSPTPRHEIEEALDAPESAVRIYTLMGAFTGTAAGAALAIWTSLDWPLIVGGKEIVALPAFSVIMFEVTVLLGALSTVAGLFLTGAPARASGRPEALYHPSFTADRFGVFAHVAPEHFEEVRDIMNESGSEEVLLDQG